MSGVIQLNPFTLWLSEWMTESCDVLSGLITQNMELLGKYFHIVADLRMGRGDSPPFPVKFCQYSILSKITISYLYSWQVSRCDTPPLQPPPPCLNFLDLPLHITLFVFQHFTKLSLNVEFCWIFTLAIPWVREDFCFFQIVSTAYFILGISNVGLWSQGTLATFWGEKVKPKSPCTSLEWLPP